MSGSQNDKTYDIWEFLLSEEELPDLSGTLPYFFRYGKKRYEADTWAEFFTFFCSFLYDKRFEKLSKLKSRSIPGVSRRVLFSVSPLYLRRPRRIGNRFFVETNLGANRIIKICSQLADLCNIDKNKIVIQFYKEAEDEEEDPIVEKGESVESAELDKPTSINKGTIAETQTEADPGQVLPLAETSSVNEMKSAEIRYDIWEFLLSEEELPDLSGTLPYFFQYGKERYEADTWADFFTHFCTFLYERQSSKLAQLKSRPIPGVSKRVLFSGSPHLLRRPKQIDSYFYVETNLSSNKIIRLCSRLANLCNVPKDKITIQFYKETVDDGEDPIVEQGENPVESAELVENAEPVSFNRATQIQTQKETNTGHVFSLAEMPSVSGMKPTGIKIENREFSAEHWSTVWVCLFNEVERKNPGVLRTLADRPENRLKISRWQTHFVAPKRLECGLYIETNYSALAAWKRAQSLSAYCGVPLEKVHVLLAEKSANRSSTGSEELRPDHSPKLTQNNSQSPEPAIETGFDRFVEQLPKTLPQTLTIFGEECKTKHWRQVFQTLCETAEKRVPGRLKQLVGRHFDFALFPPFLSDGTRQGFWPQKITEGLWIEKCYQDNVLAKLCQAVCRWCGFGARDVYLGENAGGAYQSWDQPKLEGREFGKKLPELGSELETDLQFLLHTYFFETGYRCGSIITFGKLQNYAEEEGLSSIEGIPPKVIDETMKRVGLFVDGKVFPVSEEYAERLDEKISDIFQSGVSVIGYESLHQKVYKDFPDFFSPEYMIGLLKRCLPDKYRYGERILTTKEGDPFQNEEQEKEAVAAEIENHWTEKDGRRLTVEEIARKLPNITPELIWNVLDEDPGFLKQNKIYIRLPLLTIPESVKARVLKQVETEVQTEGYLFLTDLEIEDLKQLNEDVPETELRYALFKLLLSDRYKRSGRVVSSLGDKKTTTEIIEDYCLKRKYCSVSEIETRFAEAIGSNPFFIDVLEENKVRRDEDQFVPIEDVHFNVDQVDYLIDATLGERKHLPVSGFITFVNYPLCELRWNKYLLQSYCRHFSKRFTALRRPGNKSFLGAIARKESKYVDYNDLLADELAHSGVDLTSDQESFNHLIKKGYLENQQSKKTFTEIITAAVKLREGI